MIDDYNIHHQLSPENADYEYEYVTESNDNDVDEDGGQSSRQDEKSMTHKSLHNQMEYIAKTSTAYALNTSLRNISSHKKKEDNSYTEDSSDFGKAEEMTNHLGLNSQRGGSIIN